MTGNRVSCKGNDRRPLMVREVPYGGIFEYAGELHMRTTEMKHECGRELPSAVRLCDGMFMYFRDDCMPGVLPIKDSVVFVEVE